MFTGLVEEVGRVREPRPLQNGRAFRVEATGIMEELSPGDSVAVDGVCLTVTDLIPGAFEVQCVATTLERTALGGYDEGRRVNLERALKLGDRLGGHLVQGHVDGVGRVRSVARVGELVLLEVEVPEDVAAVTVLHGSITLNGVSLTVNQLPGPTVVGVSIIPYTWSHTALADLRSGDAVNIEGDMIGKYVRRLLGPPGTGSDDGSADLLRRWGY